MVKGCKVLLGRKKSFKSPMTLRQLLLTTFNQLYISVLLLEKNFQCPNTKKSYLFKLITTLLIDLTTRNFVIELGLINMYNNSSHEVSKFFLELKYSKCHYSYIDLKSE